MYIPEELKRVHFTSGTWDRSEITNAIFELQNGYYVCMGANTNGTEESIAWGLIMKHFDSAREIEIVRGDWGRLYLHKIAKMDGEDEQ